MEISHRKHEPIEAEGVDAIVVGQQVALRSGLQVLMGWWLRVWTGGDVGDATIV